MPLFCSNLTSSNSMLHFALMSRKRVASAFMVAPNTPLVSPSTPVPNSPLVSSGTSLLGPVGIFFDPGTPLVGPNVQTPIWLT